jgi:hypothetical protein
MQKLSSHINQLKRQLGIPEQVAEANQAGLVNSDSDPNQREYELAYWRRVAADKQYPKPTAVDWLRHLVSKGIVIDDENSTVVTMLCQYFAQDPAFEETGGKLSKGLMLRGPIGCGKTTLMRMFASNARQSFYVRACLTISQAFASDRKDDGGPPTLIPYYGLHRTGSVDRYFGQKFIGVCFDDLGTEEPPAIHFGNRCNVMEKIIFQRYANGLPFHATHLTTNLSNDQLKAAYGERVYDRMKEMLNIVDFPESAQSRRK